MPKPNKILESECSIQKSTFPPPHFFFHLSRAIWRILADSCFLGNQTKQYYKDTSITSFILLRIVNGLGWMDGWEICLITNNLNELDGGNRQIVWWIMEWRGEEGHHHIIILLNWSSLCPTINMNVIVKSFLIIITIIAVHHSLPKIISNFSMPHNF
jgi:hypothetical protein